MKKITTTSIFTLVLIASVVIITMGSLNIVRADYPLNASLDIGTPDQLYEWNHTGTFLSSEQVNITDALNAAIDHGYCNCTGCNINKDICAVPFIFSSSDQGGINYTDITFNISIELLNATADYNLDPGCVSPPAGDINFINNSRTAYLNTNVTVNYTYCEEIISTNKVSGWTKNVEEMIPGFFLLCLLMAIMFILYSVLNPNLTAEDYGFRGGGSPDYDAQYY